MPALVTTLSSRIEQAEQWLQVGRVGRALKAFEEIVFEAQERSDVAAEVTARSMLARCNLLRREFGEARAQLEAAAYQLDPMHLQAVYRYRGAAVRLELVNAEHSEARSALREYLEWAEQARVGAAMLDAYLLLADTEEVEERVGWLQRAIDTAGTEGLEARLGGLYELLGITYARVERDQEALESYQLGLQWHARHGSARQLAATEWAAGATACRLEDWPLARVHLEKALEHLERSGEAEDLLSLVLVDLARVYEAAGDVIEARRLMVRGALVAREQGFPLLWPERWEALVRYGRTLELEL